MLERFGDRKNPDTGEMQPYIGEKSVLDQLLIHCLQNATPKLMIYSPSPRDPSGTY
jgi:hypothetical protein